MRYSKGRWIASYKDTYSLDCTLSPIIYAGLSKFHEVLEKRNKEKGCLGVPDEYMKDPEQWVTDSDVQDWLDDIKKMMYAFGDTGPDITEYDFKTLMIPVPEKKGYTLQSTNKSERDRYHNDCKIHEEKVQEGLNLFGQKFKSLWW